jgi:phage repressor protein C with HTH and peptisase S24 domain
MPDFQSDKELIDALVKWSGSTASDLARTAGLTPSTLTRPLNHSVKHRLSTPTLRKLKATYPRFPGWADEPDLPVAPDLVSYVPIDIMPTYAGMGGGGTGEGEIERALVPRYLIESVFRGSPSDFVIIRTRGDSMFPDFEHDDEILCDKRDRNPIQPGPFAIWDAEDEAYVVKNVEKVDGSRYRIFSTNTKYTPREVDREETRIIGRPVWYGRRL